MGVSHIAAILEKDLSLIHFCSVTFIVLVLIQQNFLFSSINLAQVLYSVEVKVWRNMIALEGTCK